MKKYLGFLVVMFCAVFVQNVNAVNTGGSDIEIILDVSGSMAGQVEGGTKLDVAKNALGTVINQMPVEANVGFRAYGHRSTSANKDCQDSELIYPISAVNKSQLTSKINSLQPGGWTPIDYSLQQSKNDFPVSSEMGKMIILVSDGEETCGGDPCATIKQMKSDGFDVTVNTVGFDVSDIAEQQLKCIAQATGGEYKSAKNASDLVNSMTFFSNRAFEGFANAGGATAGTGFTNAPLVDPGTYGGDIRTGENKFYKVNVIKGQEIIANLSIKREQAMSEDWSCLCMLPGIQLYDKFQSVVDENNSVYCYSWGKTEGLYPDSTKPSSYKVTWISDRTGEVFVSIGNDWEGECAGYHAEEEKEKSKKDKALYDLVIAVEGEGEVVEKVADTVKNSLIPSSEKDDNNIASDIDPKEMSNNSNLLSTVMIGGIIILVLLIIGLVIFFIVSKKKDIDSVSLNSTTPQPQSKTNFHNTESNLKVDNVIPKNSPLNSEIQNDNASSNNLQSQESAQSIFCSDCGHKNEAGAKFCSGCGKSL